MISSIRDICIFMIIAQTILYFVPGESYMKYVRVLVGIMMILKITEPIFGFFLDEGRRQELENTAEQIKRAVEEGRAGVEAEEDFRDIYDGIEEELRKKLGQCQDGYAIVSVDLYQGKEGEDMVAVTLSRKGAGEQGGIRVAPVELGEEERLQELYGGCLGVDPGRIAIIFQ